MMDKLAQWWNTWQGYSPLKKWLIAIPSVILILFFTFVVILVVFAGINY